MHTLVHLADIAAGFTRLRRGKSFRYVDAKGRTLKNNGVQARIRSLAIPPAQTDVWISPKANSHLQATGRDAHGRKQYRCHPAFRAHQEQEKFQHLIDFAKALPAIRRTVRAAIESVAAHRGNTATICRKCYIHPAILETYMVGELALTIKQRAAANLRGGLHRLKPEEAAVLALLQARLKSKPRKNLAKA